MYNAVSAGCETDSLRRSRNYTDGKKGPVPRFPLFNKKMKKLTRSIWTAAASDCIAYLRELDVGI